MLFTIVWNRAVIVGLPAAACVSLAVGVVIGTVVFCFAFQVLLSVEVICPVLSFI